jgi:RNA polymerase sigma factor (sigma-70 family)
MGFERNELLRMLVAERASLLGFITSLCRDREVAEDVFQTLVVITSEQQPAVETREKFLSWARTVARHEASRLGRVQRRTVRLDDEVLGQLERRWAAADRVPEVPLAEALERCLTRLTPAARGLLRLRFEKMMSGEELARSVGRSLNTVYVERLNAT